MDVLWDADTWLTPREVRAGLSRDVAPTTVGTVLSRLLEKGRVERRKHGSGFQYQAVETREEHVASIMEAALEGSRDRPVALLEFVDRLPANDRSRLRKILGL
jgi:predicted transcriptional regulator